MRTLPADMSEPEEAFWQSFHGPAETPEMIADKWYIKFRDFLERYYFLPQYHNEIDPSWMCSLCIEGISYVRTFKYQARRSSIDLADYPKFEGPVYVEAKDMKFAAESQMAKMKKNPFVAAAHVTYALPPIIRRFEVKSRRWRSLVAKQALQVKHRFESRVFFLEKVKHGGMMYRLLTWNSLPLQWRQAMNDTFLLLEEGIKVGWWSRPDFVREGMEKAYKMKETRLKEQLGWR